MANIISDMSNIISDNSVFISTVAEKGQPTRPADKGPRGLDLAAAAHRTGPIGPEKGQPTRPADKGPSGHKLERIKPRLLTCTGTHGVVHKSRSQAPPSGGR